MSTKNMRMWRDCMFCRGHSMAWFFVEKLSRSRLFICSVSVLCRTIPSLASISLNLELTTSHFADPQPQMYGP
jgi:hypothetical protein